MVYNFKIGDIVVHISSPIKLEIDNYYSKFLSNEKNANIKIDIFGRELTELNIPDYSNCKDTYIWINHDTKKFLYFNERGKRLCDSNNSDTWCLVCNEDFTICQLYVNKSCLENKKDFSYQFAIRPWIQRVYIAYLGVKYKKKYNSFVMHGGCISLNKHEGIILLGNSGAGKSTACEIGNFNGFTSISDDRLLVKVINKKLYCYATPWNTKNPHLTQNRYLHVKKIFFLYHGDNHYNEIKSFVDFNKQFSKQIIHSRIFLKNDIAIWKLKNSHQVFNIIKSYNIFFRPDISFINMISQID